MNRNERIIWVDIAKAIAIVSMILGHILPSESSMQRLIYSFHMPLFFICSGLFENISVKKDKIKIFLKKGVKRLIIPVIASQIILGAVKLTENLKVESAIPIVKNELIKFFWASAYEPEKVYLGAMWFLIALFWSKILFYIVQLYISVPYNGIVYLFLALFGASISKYMHLPQAGDVVLVSALFVYIGAYLGCHMDVFEKHSFVISVVSFIVWIFCWENGIYLSMGDRYYSQFVICICEAVCGCFCVFMLSKALSNTFCSKQLAYIGRNTLLILCVHYLSKIWDFLWEGKSLWEICVFHVVIDVGIALTVAKIYEVLKKDGMRRDLLKKADLKK